MESRVQRDGKVLLSLLQKILERCGADGQLIQKLVELVKQLLAGMLTEENFKLAADMVLDKVEEYLEASDSSWAPWGLNLCEMVRRLFDIPDNDDAAEMASEIVAKMDAT